MKRPILVCSARNWLRGIRRVKGVRRIGVRIGNWLTAEQSKRLLAGAESLRGKRNYAMIAMLIGCGLRSGELLALRVNSIQVREEHWIIADLLGKAGHIRTVPIPEWVKAATDEWENAAGITDGALSGRDGPPFGDYTSVGILKRPAAGLSGQSTKEAPSMVNVQPSPTSLNESGLPQPRSHR